MFRLAYPLLLTLWGIVAGWFVWRLKRKPVGITYSLAARLSRLTSRTGQWAGKIPLILRAGCLVLLVFAAARPQLYNVSRDIQSPGVDIVLCLDTSGSMQALDFTIGGEPVSRLAAVKKVVGEFIEKRELDRIGLVVFGTQAFTQSPLTLDKGLLMELVNRMEIGMAGDKTAIGSVDGLSPAEAAEALEALGIKIYTIGVGGTGPAPFAVKTPFGTKIIRQRVDLDEETLMKVAEIGRGQYFRAAETDRLEEIYDIIDQQEKTEVKIKEFFHFKELYFWFLVPAIILLLVEIVMRTTVLGTIP